MPLQFKCQILLFKIMQFLLPTLYLYSVSDKGPVMQNTVPPNNSKKTFLADKYGPLSLRRARIRLGQFWVGRGNVFVGRGTKQTLCIRKAPVPPPHLSSVVFVLYVAIHVCRKWRHILIELEDTPVAILVRSAAMIHISFCLHDTLHLFQECQVISVNLFQTLLFKLKKESHQ